MDELSIIIFWAIILVLANYFKFIHAAKQFSMYGLILPSVILINLQRN